MSPRTRRRGRPGPLLRALLRAPIPLYHAGLGWLLGTRFVLLVHRGRRTGRTRETVLEVVRHDRSSGIVIVASGFGAAADWFRNLMADPRCAVAIGGARFDALAVRLDPVQARDELREYARRHPLALRGIGRFLLGRSVTASDADLDEMVAHVPLVRLARCVPHNGDAG